MDFDGDGIKDMFSGSYSPGHLFVFRGNSDGTFEASEKVLDKKGSPVVAGSASAPFAVDWDNDGDLDLVIGIIDGSVFLVPNEGTRETPAYGTKVPLRAGNQPIKLVGDAGPTVADWDGDGLPDLLVGADDGAVYFYRATARDESGQLVLAPGEAIVPPSQGHGRSASSDRPWGIRLKVTAADFNNDGLLDLLVGDFNTSQPPAPPAQPQLSAEKRRELEQQRYDLMRQYQQLIKEVAGNGPADETAEQQRERYRQAMQDDRVKEAMTKMNGISQQLQPAPRPQRSLSGFVWYFQRRGAAEAQ